MRKFKIGDSVYLKEEACYKRKRIWTITHIVDNIFHLERVVKRKATFKFLESATADQLVKV